MLNNKRLADFADLFSPNNFKKMWWNNTWIFSIMYRWKKIV